MKNIFEIWRDNNKELPIIVQRNSWGNSIAVVMHIDSIKEYEDGRIYGKAYGQIWKNNELTNNIYWQSETKNGYNSFFKEISCAGCYQWFEL